MDKPLPVSPGYAGIPAGRERPELPVTSGIPGKLLLLSPGYLHGKTGSIAFHTVETGAVQALNEARPVLPQAGSHNLYTASDFPMNRRTFIQSGITMCVLAGRRPERTSAPYLMTVNGPVPAENAGFILSHEHILVDFTGSGWEPGERYDRGEVFKKALPYLKHASQMGCNTLVECTPAGLGRDVRLLRELSKVSGLHILTNTGYYGAAGEKFLPPHAHTETAARLAARWIAEWKDGIDGTLVRPGFIKTGVDAAPLSALQRKLIEAAAETHLHTGLVIGIHTGNGKAALEESAILKEAGVKPGAWIWIHAQNEQDRALHYELAREGTWISFDGLNERNLAAYVGFLSDMKRAKLLHRALVSHDAGWYHVGEPEGGIYRGYTPVFTALVPTLKKEGFTQAELDLLFRQNPARAWAVGAES